MSTATISMDHITITALNQSNLPALLAHLRRHFAESGDNGFHFMPFAPDDPIGPNGVDIDKTALPIGMLQWQRWFIAIDSRTGNVCGHVDLKADGLRTGIHRCALGIGIEAAYRGIGLGKALMNTAIDFVRNEDSIEWLDLMVFGHNKNAQALYKSCGFTEIGTVIDRFRIGELKIDDVMMTLKVTQ